MSTATVTRCPGRENSVANLLLAIGEGDRSAWEEILRRYGGLVVATVRSFRLREADAHDAVQTTWMRLLEQHHRVQSPQYLGGWLVTTARRECLHILRRARRTTNVTELVDDYADPSAGPEQKTVDALTSGALCRLLTELTPRQRTVIRALFVDDRPYNEISRITGIPPGSIGPTRTRALALLRRKLHEQGLA